MTVFSLNQLKLSFVIKYGNKNCLCFSIEKLELQFNFVRALWNWKSRKFQFEKKTLDNLQKKLKMMNSLCCIKNIKNKAINNAYFN